MARTAELITDDRAELIVKNWHGAYAPPRRSARSADRVYMIGATPDASSI